MAVIRGPEPYTFADRPDTAPQAVIHPGQHCTTPWGDELEEAMSLGVRTWGNSRDGGATMLVGTYERRSEISERMLEALPQLVVLRAGEWDSPLVGLLADEVVKDEPGQELVLDRLLDLLVIAAVRAWFARPDAPAPAWYRAHTDPVVGKAVRMLHHNPEHAWTVANLAAEVGLSRAALARRFTELVASRRCRSSPAGAWPSPPTCCGSRAPRWGRWPARSATAARSPTLSTARSSGVHGVSPATAPPTARPFAQHGVQAGPRHQPPAAPPVAAAVTRSVCPSECRAGMPRS